MPLTFEWDDIPETVISQDFCEKEFSCDINFDFFKSCEANSAGAGDKSCGVESDGAVCGNLLIKYENLQVLKWLAGENGAGKMPESAVKASGAGKMSESAVKASGAESMPESAVNFLGKINLIYIDPPYNTGNDFAYNDNFSLQHDRHSAWLSFMKRRLELARRLLCEDGCIFIAIGQEELFVLKLLCDKIFGEENFVNDFMWLHGKGKKDTWSRTLVQHTLCYAYDKTKLKPFKEIEQTSWAKTNADNDPRGNGFSGSISFTEQRSNPNHKNFYSITSPSKKVWQRQWLVSREEMEKLIRNIRKEEEKDKKIDEGLKKKKKRK